MNKFSKRSKKKLKSCHKLLQDIFKVVIQRFDCTIIQGERTKKQQDEYFRTGKSKVEWPNSKHNTSPSIAVDVAPSPIDWNDTVRFYYFAGYVKAVAHSMGIDVRWGGDWDGDNDLHDQTFMDLVHFELKGDY